MQATPKCPWRWDVGFPFFFSWEFLSEAHERIHGEQSSVSLSRWCQSRNISYALVVWVHNLCKLENKVSSFNYIFLALRRNKYVTNLDPTSISCNWKEATNISFFLNFRWSAGLEWLIQICYNLTNIFFQMDGSLPWQQ